MTTRLAQPLLGESRPTSTSPAAKATWGLFLVWIAICLGNHMQTAAENAIQQAALSGNTCVALLGGYVICRAVDAVTRRD